MCRNGWKHEHLNPSGIKTITREYKHEPISLVQDVRGGPKSADHVDIMGNFEMISDILQIVAGKGEMLQDHVSSPIDEIGNKIDRDLVKFFQ